MRSSIALSTLLALLTPSLVTASAVTSNIVSRAAIVGRDTELCDSYDYVIVGAGASGLTVADRLSENRHGAYFYRIFIRISQSYHMCFLTEP